MRPFRITHVTVIISNPIHKTRPDPQTHSHDHIAYLIHMTWPIRHTHVTTQPTWSTRRDQSDTLTWPHSLPDPHDAANQTHSRDHTAYLIHNTRPIRHTHVTTQPTWYTRRGQSDTLTWPHSLPDPQDAANQTHSRDHTAYLIHNTRPIRHTHVTTQPTWSTRRGQWLT